MFWKTAGEHKRWSLAARISIWHAASTFLLLAFVTGLLYWALAAGLRSDDDEVLEEKISTIATLLKDPQANARMIEWEVEGEAFAHLLSRVLDAAGRTVIETSGMSRDLPAAAFPAGSGSSEVFAGGRPWLAGSAAGPTGHTVQVAIDLAREQTLLASYRRRLWLVLAAGLLASVLVGYAIGRQGMRPVNDITAAIRHTTSATLGERVPAEGLPAEAAALAETFNGMLDRLEDAFSRLSRFSSDIAHELRTPVNNLRLDVEVALSKARTSEEYRDALASLLEDLLGLSKLIDSLLFLARSENPETQIRRDLLPLRQELEAIRDFYEAPASEAGVTLEVDVAGEPGAPLDRTLFQRAVGNLVDNALAHTPRGGRITLGAKLEDGGVVVAVTDTGAGIPAEHLPHVFERFHRVDAARSKHSGGVGLGLAIVRSIAVLHGGTANIDSRPGEGTAVRLFFPG